MTLYGLCLRSCCSTLSLSRVSSAYLTPTIAFNKTTTVRPRGAVSLRGDTAQRDGAAWLSRRDFLHFFDPVTLTFDLLSFDLILIGGRGIMMDYPLYTPVGGSSVSKLCGIRSVFLRLLSFNRIADRCDSDSLLREIYVDHARSADASACQMCGVAVDFHPH